MNENVHFDEEIKGHKLLVTSHVVAFKGKQIDTSAVNSVTTVVFRHSVNAIPSSSSYKVRDRTAGLTKIMNEQRQFREKSSHNRVIIQ